MTDHKTPLTPLEESGLRVKPLEFFPWAANNVRATSSSFTYIIRGDGQVQTICHATHIIKTHRVKNAEIFCQRHHESQVLALLEQVEGGQ